MKKTYSHETSPLVINGSTKSDIPNVTTVLNPTINSNDNIWTQRIRLTSGVHREVDVNRTNWPERLKYLQKWYDQPPVGKMFRRLWRITDQVRKIRQQEGYGQNVLLPDCSALGVSGIIYAIFSKRSRKIYVGQSIHSSTERFKQHVWKAQSERGDAQTPLYTDMVKYGSSEYFIFPLEYIPPERYQGMNQAKRKKAFRQIATPLEMMWIEKLRTWDPYGYNVQFAERKRRRKRRSRYNPMMWKRARRARMAVEVNTGDRSGVITLNPTSLQI